MPSSYCPQCGEILSDRSLGQPFCQACGATLPVELYWRTDTAGITSVPSESAAEDDRDRTVAAIRAGEAPPPAEELAPELPNYTAGEQPHLDIGLGRLSFTEHEVQAFVGPGASYYLGCWAAAISHQGQPRGFNLAAALFAPIWLPYRKLYVAAGLCFAGLIVLALFQRFLFLQMLGLAEVPSWFILATAVGLAILVGFRANTWYWNKAQEVIWRVRQQGLSAEDHYGELRRRGGRSVAALVATPVIGLGAVVGANLLLDQVPLFNEIARLERAVREGMEKDQKIRVAECRLRRQPDGNIKGTLTEVGGEEWDILRVWAEGRQVKWFFAEPVSRLKARLSKQVNEQFMEYKDHVKFADVKKAPDGTFSGTIETEAGIVCDILQTPSDVFPRQVYWQINENCFPNYLKVVSRRETQPDLTHVRLEKKGAKEWQGDATDRLGGRYHVVLRLRGAAGGGPADALGQAIEWELTPQAQIQAVAPAGGQPPWVGPGGPWQPGWGQPKHPFGPPPFPPIGPFVPKGPFPIR